MLQLLYHIPCALATICCPSVWASLQIDTGLCLPFQDHPMLIGESQTISAPHIHAQMLELLSPHLPDGGRALDVGAGRPCFFW